MKYNRVVSYAMDFLSFLLEHILPDNKKHIRNVILFGSGARGEYKGSSDVDIFIEILGKSESLEKEVERVTEDFYDSAKYKNYWKLKGFKQIFSCKIGNRKLWGNIYPALISDGILLYGKYSSSEIPEKNKVLFFWDNISFNNKRINLYRSLYGYKARKKIYPGFLELYNSQKLAKGCILVPLEYCQNFRDLFKKTKIPAKEMIISIL